MGITFAARTRRSVSEISSLTTKPVRGKGLQGVCRRRLHDAVRVHVARQPTCLATMSTMSYSSPPAASGSPAKPPTTPCKCPESITIDLTWQGLFPFTNRVLQLDDEDKHDDQPHKRALQLDSEDDVVDVKRRRRPFKCMPDATKARLQVEACKSLDDRELNKSWMAMGADKQRAEGGSLPLPASCLYSSCCSSVL